MTDHKHNYGNKVTPAARARMQQRTAQEQLLDTLRELREPDPPDVPDADDASVRVESLR